jgi:hypothetical protein
MTKFEKYLETVKTAQKENPSWRRGQAMFNVLYILYPKLADRCRGGYLDPFHADYRDNADEKIEAFLDDVKKQLEKEHE